MQPYKSNRELDGSSDGSFNSSLHVEKFELRGDGMAFPLAFHPEQLGLIRLTLEQLKGGLLYAGMQTVCIAVFKTKPTSNNATLVKHTLLIL